jgi:hypothetical protein
MPLTHFPHGVSSMGVPVLSGSKYAGMWTSRVLFVDGDNGSDIANGLSPKTAYKTLAKAIDVAGLDETIYVRPKKTTTNWDTLYGASAPTGTYLENATITALTKSGLNIIGTGNGTGVQGKGVQWMGVSGIVSPTVEIRAAFVNVENIIFSPMAAQVTVASSVIRMYNVAASGGYAYGCSIINCGFEVSQFSWKYYC